MPFNEGNRQMNGTKAMSNRTRRMPAVTLLMPEQGQNVIRILNWHMLQNDEVWNQRTLTIIMTNRDESIVTKYETSKLHLWISQRISWTITIKLFDIYNF